VFKYTDNNAVRAIVDYTGDASTITLNSKRVNNSSSKYIVARYAFEGDNSSIEKIIVDTAVSNMYSQAFCGLNNLSEVRVLSGVSLNYEGAFVDCYIQRLVLSTTAGTVTGNTFYNASGYSIYFEGTQDQWNNNFNVKWNTLNLGMVYIYDACAHNGDQWNYDANKNVQTPYKEYQYRVIKDATCRKEGTAEWYCNDCRHSWQEPIYAYGHSYIDEVCTRCGYIDNMWVTSYTLNHFKNVFTVSNTSKTPFRLFTNYDSIESTNKTANSTATLTFTAKQDMTISFIVQVYGTETGSLTVKSGTSSGRTFMGGTSYEALSYTVYKGQSVSFTYTQTVADESGYAKIYDIRITSLNEPY
jgi:hypothetical protein